MLPRYSHPKSPHHFTLPQLAACVLLMFYLDLSYRDMEEWLLASDRVCQELGLSRIPDHTTLQRTFQKLRRLDFEKMKNQLLEEIGVDEEGIACDSTGFSPGQASLYYQTRRGRLYRHWAKGVYAVGIASQFILSWRSGWGPGSDVAYLSGLRRDARRYGHYQGKRKGWVLLADAGFDGQTVGDDELIPPVRRGGSLLNPERRGRAERVSQARLDGLFGQRWKAETVNSVIKRKFGDTIRSRKRSLQRREPIVKGLVYNIHL
ncbi:MAG: Mobile element protein [Anaerolineae bacterium]|nr:MAG: Mobile element protein [Anaerolineae bacterium]